MSDLKSILKTSLLFLQISFCTITAFAQGWEFQSAPAGTVGLSGVTMLNADVAFAVGSKDVIIKTTNAGTTWLLKSKDFPSVYDALYTICFTDSNNWWTVGAGGVILHSSDGGESWVQQTGGGNATLNSVSFCNDSVGMIVGYNIILRTTNKGATWINQTPTPPDSYLLTGVVMFSPDTAVAVGHNGIIRTADGGVHWANIFSVPGAYYESVSFADSKNGAAAGYTNYGYGLAVATTDGGITWTMKFQDTILYRYGGSISCPDKYHWTFLAWSASIFRTTNGGSVWFTQDVDVGNGFLRGVSFSDSMNGMIMGSGGNIILHTTNGGSASARILLSYPPDKSVNQPSPITLSWRNSRIDSSFYRLQISKDPNFLNNIIFDDSTLVDTFKTIGGLASNTKYYWRVRAVTPIGIGYWSPVWSYRTFAYLAIRQIQETPATWLIFADSLQNTQPDRWTLQASPWNDDSLTITAICVVPPDVLSGSRPEYTMVVYDTTQTATAWRGIIIRADSSLDGIRNVRAGHVLVMRGRIYEEPAGSMNSLTVFEPRSIMITDSVQAPQAVSANLYDFYDEAYPGGKVYYSTGEKYEAMTVQLHNLRVSSYVGNPPSAFTMTDGGGNMMASSDASKWFTLRGHRDSASTYSLPPIGAHIASISGVITVMPDTENGRGYCIAPVYPGDIVFGAAPTGKISGIIYNDADGDSTRDSSEAGIGGFRIWLRGTGSIRTRSAVTGVFTFNDLDPGSYVVTPETRRGWVWTDPASGSYNPVLGSNDTVSGLAFGSHYVGSIISGTVFYDGNQNGLLDSWERRLPGWRVRISGPKADSILTDKAGNYRFIELPDGQYTLGIKMPQYWLQSYPQEDQQYSISIIREGDSFTGLEYGICYAPRLRLAITVQDNTPFAYRDIWWGVRTLATYGIWGVDPNANRIDSLEGEYEIPPPTLGIFDARFQDPHGALDRFGCGSWTDIRDFHSTAQVDTHRVFFLPGYFFGGDYPMTLRWSKEMISSSFNGSVTLSDSGGHLIDMKSTDSLVITDPRVYSLILVSQWPALSPDLMAKWNIVSAPADYGNNSLKALFPSAVSGSFSYKPGAGYQMKDTLLPGKGYWVKCQYMIDSVVLNIGAGTGQSIDTIHVSEGWNLVGGPASAVTAGEIASVPVGIITSEFFGYGGGYYPVLSLQPMKGYWVRTKQDGRLVLGGSPLTAKGKNTQSTSEYLLENCDRLIIRETGGREQVLYYSIRRNELKSERFELPPLPPSGEFDARFSSNCLAAMVPDGKQGKFLITITGAQYPVTISWERKSENVKASLTLGDREISIRESGSIRLTAEDQAVVLNLVGSSDIPKDFLLEQNYPNPFNPVTTIKYMLPEAAHVSLKIYDLLGREVKTLADGAETEGFKSAKWDSRNGSGIEVASGIYFYRIDVTGLKGERLFSQVKKMLLLR